MINRRERFQRLYPKRLEKALWSIRSIGKLSEKSNYIYKDDEIIEIISSLLAEIKATIIKFKLTTPNQDQTNAKLESEVTTKINDLENLFNKRNDLILLELESLKRNLRM